MRSLLGMTLLAASLFAQDPGAQPAQADEPGRSVARLSVLSGDASVRRGDSGDFVAAALNAPLMAGDWVAVAPGGAVELQLDSANFLRIAGDSEVRISNLENGRYQLQLAKGLLTYRILRQTNTQPEISTALIAVRPVNLSAARIEVFPDGTTHVNVRHGQVEIYTPRGTEHASEGNLVTVRGAVDDPEYQVASSGPTDQWDNWNDQRDAYLMRSQAPRYVSQDISGAEDLDAYGQWSYDPQYGNVWAPSVASGWAPYRNGQWVWEDYYGWTWVDSSPWGWAPFHYGSWYQRAGIGWCWYPGERLHHYWWHPALVGFVGFGGGFGVGFGFGNVGWIPLAPFEVFHPWYGRGFGGGYGHNNVFINNIVRNTNVTNIYRNARDTNGVTAVSAADFQRGNFRNPVAVDRGQLQQAAMVRGAVPITPSSDNLRFTNRSALPAIARGDVANQRFFSRSSVGAGLPQRTPFSQQQAAVRSAFDGSATAGQTSRFSSQQGGGAYAAGGANNGSPTPRGDSTAGWQRFGNPQTNSPSAHQPRYNQAPASDSGRGLYGGGSPNTGSRSLQVAPPIVNQRDSTPAYNPPPQPSRGGGGFGAPAYRSAPAQSYPSAPDNSGYRATPAPNYRSAPDNSGYRAAPAPSYRSAPDNSGGRAAPSPSYRSAPDNSGGRSISGGGNFGSRGGDRQGGGGGGGERGGAPANGGQGRR